MQEKQSDLCPYCHKKIRQVGNVTRVIFYCQAGKDQKIIENPKCGGDKKKCVRNLF